MTRLVVVLMFAMNLPAQMTLSEAVDSALRNYPSVRVSQEQINAAAAGIQLARTAYLPRVDAIAQVNRATRNNVFGLLLPQSVIPSISGPVLGTNNFGTAWGSAMGVLVTWEPFDFGLRKASVDASAAARAESEAALKKTQFDVSVAAADAYVTLVAAQETVRAAQAGLDRAEAISRTIHALVQFSAFDRAAIRAKEAGQSATIRAETARYQQIATDLTAAWNRAVAMLGGARNVAANTPVQVAAARAATDQATARYQSGLGNIDEVAEAQRLLTQSEIDDALARLGVWRGLLGVATAAGDIGPFVAEASQ